VRTRFAHIADVHLGNEQYGMPERFNDFGRAWLSAVDRCIAERVDFVIIAGDLFEKRSVEPRALVQAQEGLDMLRGAGIPAVAVEGNHDRALYVDGMSWMEFLDYSGLLILLSPMTSRSIKFEPHTTESCGVYTDIGDVRIVGQPFLGAAAADRMSDMAPHLMLASRRPYTIYLCHIGLEGVVPHAPGCITEEEFSIVQPFVDYVATGHIHRRFERDEWLYNPGSLEACGVDEALIDHGFFIVDVDTSINPKHRTTYIQSVRRSWACIEINAGDFTTNEDLERSVKSLVTEAAKQSEDTPIIDVKIVGQTTFGKIQVDSDAVKENSSEVLSVTVRNKTSSPSAASPSGEPSDELTRSEIEHGILSSLFAQREPYASQASAWASLTAEIKDVAQTKFTPSEVLAMLEAQVTKIQSQDLDSTHREVPDATA